MLTLAVETSGRVGSVAIVGEEVMGQRISEPSRGHGGPLLAEIDALIREAGLTPGDIELFVASAGPGSFTGVRVGLATAKSLAWALGRRVTAFGSLQVLAHNASDLEGFVAPIVDARKGEVYGALYRMEQGIPECVLEPVVASPPAWRERVLAYTEGVEPAWLGSGRSVYADVFRGTEELDDRPHAVVLARIAQRRAALDLHALPHAVPRYVRPSEAEVKFGPAPVHDPLAGVDEGS